MGITEAPSSEPWITTDSLELSLNVGKPEILTKDYISPTSRYNRTSNQLSNYKLLIQFRMPQHCPTARLADPVRNRQLQDTLGTRNPSQIISLNIQFYSTS